MMIVVLSVVTVAEAALALHVLSTEFHDGFLIGAMIAAPLTLILEHYVMRPFVRWHAMRSRLERLKMARRTRARRTSGR